MLTKKESRANDRVKEVRDKGLACAVSLLIERISSLPEADKADLYELLKCLRKAQSQEELDATFESMLEILDQEPVKAKPLEVSEDRPERLQKWVSFVSAKIKELRVAADMTQADLAERSGLPQSHISRLEAGRHSPSRLTLEKLAKAFGVKLSVLDPSEE